ncbi:MAG: hypothetical protein K0S12_418 [Bacteroidetes bacterium]|jgi:hypothetical protein|nr:hypothetical protein [Bacteroidota bacterium]
MKTLLLSGLLIIASKGINAQTLTKAANEPVSGDTWIKKDFDSTGVVPKNTGTGQLWNFSNFAATSQTSSVTYTTASSAPGYSLFAGANLAELKGGSEIGFYKTSGANFEFLGFYDPSGPVSLYLSNSAVMAAWPISYGSSNTDVVSGTMTSGTMSINWTGSITTTAPGSGTVILPGGNTINNCLLVVSSISMNIGTTDTYAEKRYSFYNSTNKFPVAEFAYETSTSGTTTSTYFEFEATLSALTSGVNELNSELNSVMVYPNPAHDLVKVDSKQALVQSVEILDITGKSVLQTSSADAVDVTAIQPGLYLMVIHTSSGYITKRLVIEH